jgi:hypothetical protein
VRLEFSDWDWMQACYGECVDDFYLNGPGVEGLIKAARHAAGLAVDSESIHYNSEGDACYIHFVSMEEAVETAKLAASMISSREQMIATIAVARQNGWEDG